MNPPDQSPIGLLVADHVAIAVWSLERAVVLFRDLFGGEFILGGDDDGLGIRTIQLRLPPGIKVELMQPVRTDSYLHRFLEKHGEGFHHMTFFVENVERAIEALTAQGFEVVDTNLAAPTWRETYIRPKCGFGALWQIADSTLRWDVPLPGMTVEDVLAGRLVWKNDQPVLREPKSPEKGENQA